MKSENYCSGFIALISAILIAVSLLILVIAVGFGGFYGRFAILDSEVKEMSNFLAEACVNTAIIKLVQDNTYMGDEFIAVGTRNCHVVGVADNGGGTYTITTQASSTGVFTNLVVEVDGNGTVDSWREVPGP